MSLTAHTFGSSPAAVALVEILQELGDTKITAKVSSMLNDYGRDLKLVETSSDHTQKVRIALTVRNQAISIVDQADLPKNVRTFTENVIQTRYTKFVNRID